MGGPRVLLRPETSCARLPRGREPAVVLCKSFWFQLTFESGPRHRTLRVPGSVTAPRWEVLGGEAQLQGTGGNGGHSWNSECEYRVQPYPRDGLLAPVTPGLGSHASPVNRNRSYECSVPSSPPTHASLCLWGNKRGTASCSIYKTPQSHKSRQPGCSGGLSRCPVGFARPLRLPSMHPACHRSSLWPAALPQLSSHSWAAEFRELKPCSRIPVNDPGRGGVDDFENKPGEQEAGGERQGRAGRGGSPRATCALSTGMAQSTAPAQSKRKKRPACCYF